MKGFKATLPVMLYIYYDYILARINELHEKPQFNGQKGGNTDFIPLNEH